MSDSDLQDLLSKKYPARRFWIIVILLLIVLGAVTYLLLPWLGTKHLEGHPLARITEVLAKIGEDLFSAVIVTVGIAVTVLYLLPAPDKAGKVEVISSWEIAELYEFALRRTSFWQFKGGTGTYLRARTIPAMVIFARQEHANREVHIEVINPFSEEACEQYAAYRRNFSSEFSKDREVWTAERVRHEALATVATASILNGGALTIKLGLSDTWSSFRYDMCSEYVLITNEDPSAPALRVDRDTGFYRFFKKELQLSLDQAEVIPLARTNFSVETLTTIQMLHILETSLHPWFDLGSLDKEAQAAVLKKIKHPVNYYGE